MSRTAWNVKTRDGTMDCTIHRPDTPGPHPAVIMIMDAMGVRDSIHALAERVAGAGYAVVVPNIYYRAGAIAPFDAKTVWTNPPERQRLGALMSSLHHDDVMLDLGVIIRELAGMKDIKGPKLGVMGYCMGGTLAFRAAQAFPDRVAAAACIHAGGLVSDRPDSPHLAVNRMTAEIYIGAADNDRSCTPEHRATVGRALTDAGIKHQVDFYEGKQHGFAVPDSAAYDREASERHLERSLALFSYTLRPRS